MPQDWEPAGWAEEQASRVARGITRLRSRRSAQWLSDRTAELGCQVSRSVITDLENGRRKHVGVHELIVLAQALDVPPLELLYGPDNGAEIQYLPGEERVMRLVAVQRFSGISSEVLEEYEEVITELLEVAEKLRDAAAPAFEMSKVATELIRDLRQREAENGG